MFYFACPSCLKQLFSSKSLSPCPVPTEALQSVLVSNHKIVNEGSLRLARPIRCRCGHPLGEWIVSSDSGVYDCWMVNGIWSSDHDIQGTLFKGDVCDLARKNEEIRHKLVAKISMLIPQVEGMAVKLIEVAKKYLIRFSPSSMVNYIQSLVNTMTINQLQSLCDKLAAEISEIERDQLSKNSNIKKSLKSNTLN
jgi:hypothetical protein